MLTRANGDERRAWQQLQASAQNRQERIGELLQEKFALLLTKRRRDHQLQQCRGNSALLEYNRNRLYDRYLKWKAKEFNSWQIILALQNNPLGNIAAAAIGLQHV